MTSENADLVALGKELDGLIRQGIAAVRQDDEAAMGATQEALLAFVERSPSYADALDQQANLAILDIDLGATSEAAASLKARREDMARITKTLGGVARDLGRDASALRLDRVRSVVDLTTRTVASLKEMRESLKNSASDKEVGKSIQKAIEEIQSIRSQVERL